MKKILILYNFFVDSNKYIPRFLTKLIDKHNDTNLKAYLNSLKLKHGNNIKVRVINAKNKKLLIGQYAKLNHFSEVRINIERNEFLKIKQKTSEITKKNIIYFFKNLKKLKTFNNQGLFIPKLLEFDLIRFFNTFFGQYEILNHYIQKKRPNELILFNCNPEALVFFQKLRINGIKCSYYNRGFLKKTIWRLNFLFLIFRLLGSYLKSRLYGKSKKNNVLKKNIEDNIIFIIKSKNQFNSVKPIYNYLKNSLGFNPIYYFIEYFVSFRELINLFRFLNQKRNIFLKNKKQISNSMSFNSIGLKNLLEIFYNSFLLIKLTYLFNFQVNLICFIDNQRPALGIISNDFNSAERIAAGYFKKLKIPTLYVPHSAIPIIPEFITISDIEYYALGGESDKNYYERRGIHEKNIINCGIPRYQNLYEGKINELESIRDMFDGKSYNFQKNDLTILLTTNPIDDKSNDKIIRSVIKSLMDLNLVDNLIIKLHPSESGNLHKKIIQNLNVNPVIVKDYNILELIKSCDLLISQKSTTLLEAMIIGTPMILLDFINKGFEESSKYEFLNERFIDTVKNQDSLIQEIKKIVDYKNKKEDLTQKYIQYSKNFSFYDTGEPPTEKIVNFILKLIEKKSSSN